MSETRRPTGRRFGIAWRLSLAFLAVGALAVVACVVGWLSYDRLSENLDDINRVRLPAVALSARLAEQGGAVTATAPVLALARTPAEHEAAKKGLDGFLIAMRNVLAEIRGDSAPPPSEADKLAGNVDEIARNLESLDKVVAERLALEAKNRELVSQLRWLHADFMEEAEPLLDDSRFVTQSALRGLERQGVDRPAELDRLRAELKRTDTMAALNAQANLAVGLMNRMATLTTLEELAQNMHFLAETMDSVRPEAAALASLPDAVTLRQVLNRLIELSKFEGGIPGVRRAAIVATDKSRQLLAKNRELVEGLNGAITAYVRDANQGALMAADRSAAAIATGRNLLLAVAALSMLAAIGVGILYVERNLVSRIVSLAAAARALEAGDVAPPIPLKGQDELSDMAHALKRFSDTKSELVQAAKLAALGGLAAGVGHELNQPLAAIRSHAHNGRILIGRGEDEEAGKALVRIETLTTRMAETVAHLKRFARKPEGKRVVVPLRHTIDSAIDLFGARFKVEGVAVAINVPTDMLVLAEEVRLEQVFVNLISNALDAMKDCERSTLSIEAAGEGEDVSVTVADTGRGVPIDTEAVIFDPFVTTKPVGAGLGLGLSVSYNIAKDFGGLLTLAKTGPGGSSFVLALKRANG